MPRLTLSELTQMDRADPLAPFRRRFHIPRGTVYLDGNSLGALPRATLPHLRRVARDEWGRGLIASWSGAGWIDLPHRVGDDIGRLLGAAPGQVVAADSTSVNLFKLLVAARRLRPERRGVLVVEGDFPTDRYVAAGVAELLPAPGALRAVPAERLTQALDGDTAVVLLSHVDYRTGRLHDLAALAAAAHAAGALLLADLSHSAGALPLALDAWGVDLAAGCGYKYLNGGPGAPAYLYVAHHLHDRVEGPIQGWMGHAEPFAFADGYRPAAGPARLLAGTPPVLGLAALKCGVQIALAADLAEVRAKSSALGEVLIRLVEERCAGRLELVSPRAPSARGSHVAFRHPAAEELRRQLEAVRIVVDARPPDILRFGLAPLYVRYRDLWRTVRALEELLPQW